MAGKRETAPAGDPLALLRYEHRTLDSLFSQFKLRKEHQVARRVCSHLAMHSKVEEEFYREAETIPELHGRIDTSLREHRSLEELTRAIRGLDDGDALNEQMLALQQAVEQHVREEERSVFPAVLKAVSKHRMRELGANLRATKEKLTPTGERHK